jgi:endonuclease/exonuclease/phosphatase family metal-dependent hydrolase
VQECEPLEEELLLDGEAQPTYRDRPSRTECPGRGIAVLSYTNIRLSRVRGDSEIFGFQRYEASYPAFQFNVVAVWTGETEEKASSYRQVQAGLGRFAQWSRERPTVLLGDFNSNASFRSRVWPDMVPLIEALGLVSAYHQHFSEPFGGELRPTHFFRGNASAPFHIDYCFIPGQWASRIRAVQVGEYETWRAASDHMPLIVDLDL